MQRWALEEYSELHNVNGLVEFRIVLALNAGEVGRGVVRPVGEDGLVVGDVDEDVGIAHVVVGDAPRVRLKEGRDAGFDLCGNVRLISKRRSWCWTHQRQLGIIVAILDQL